MYDPLPEAQGSPIVEAKLLKPSPEPVFSLQKRLQALKLRCGLVSPGHASARVRDLAPTRTLMGGGWGGGGGWDRTGLGVAHCGFQTEDGSVSLGVNFWSRDSYGLDRSAGSGPWPAQDTIRTSCLRWRTKSANVPWARNAKGSSQKASGFSGSGWFRMFVFRVWGAKWSNLPMFGFSCQGSGI